MGNIISSIKNKTKKINGNLYGLYCFGSVDAYGPSAARSVLNSAASTLEDNGFVVKTDAGMGVITYYVYCKKKHQRKAYELLKEEGVALGKKNCRYELHNNLR